MKKLDVEKLLYDLGVCSGEDGLPVCGDDDHNDLEVFQWGKQPMCVCSDDEQCDLEVFRWGIIMANMCGDDEQCDLEVFQWGMIMTNMCVVMISSMTLRCFSGE